MRRIRGVEGGGRAVRRFFLQTMLWTGVLLVVPTSARLLGSSPNAGGSTLWEVLFLGSSWIGFFLPFAVFAGGSAVHRQLSKRRVMGFGLVAGTAAVILLGFLRPGMEYRMGAASGVDLEARYPAGPPTLLSLLELRDLAKTTQPESLSFSVQEPLSQPLNWITLSIHTPIVLGLFAIVAALLGFLTASATYALPPPVRVNARWAVGLLTGTLFFVSLELGSQWVRADPANSGVFGAWGPLIGPVLEAAILLLVVYRCHGDSTALPHSPSHD